MTAWITEPEIDSEFPIDGDDTIEGLSIQRATPGQLWERLREVSS